MCTCNPAASLQQHIVLEVRLGVLIIQGEFIIIKDILSVHAQFRLCALISEELE